MALGLGSASKKIFSFLRGGKPPDYEDAVSKVLGLLLRYSLLDYDETSSRYSLHDLLADYALSQMQNEEEYEARRKHASYYKDVLATANALYYKGGENVLPGLRSSTWNGKIFAQVRHGSARTPM